MALRMGVMEEFLYIAFVIKLFLQILYPSPDHDLCMFSFITLHCTPRWSGSSPEYIFSKVLLILLITCFNKTIPFGWLMPRFTYGRMAEHQERRLELRARDNFITSSLPGADQLTTSWAEAPGWSVCSLADEWITNYIISAHRHIYGCIKSQ